MRSIHSTGLSVRAMSGGALALAVSIALAGCKDVHGEAAPAARPVKVAEARVPETSATVRYTVSIAPHEQIPLAFKASGYIDHVLQRRGADGQMRALQPGDLVPVGAVLARVR